MFARKKIAIALLLAAIPGVCMAAGSESTATTIGRILGGLAFGYIVLKIVNRNR